MGREKKEFRKILIAHAEPLLCRSHFAVCTQTLTLDNYMCVTFTAAQNITSFTIQVPVSRRMSAAAIINFSPSRLNRDEFVRMTSVDRGGCQETVAMGSAYTQHCSISGDPCAAVWGIGNDRILGATER